MTWRYTSIRDVIPTVLSIRKEVAVNFTDPKLLICTSSMNELLNSADKKEYQAGNITSNSQELTITGGSSSEAGQSWVYWNLPDTATRLYIRVKVDYIYGRLVYIDICDGDGSTLSNPPDYYSTVFDVYTTDRDLRLYKTINGTETEIAHEGVNLQANIWYESEFYVDTNAHTLEVWRDGEKRISVSDSDISQIASVRLRCYDDSGSEAQYNKFKGPLVVIYE